MYRHPILQMRILRHRVAEQSHRATERWTQDSKFGTEAPESMFLIILYTAYHYIKWVRGVYQFGCKLETETIQ